MNLNTKEIKEKYPKSVEELKEYLTRGYKELNVSEELKAQINPDVLTTYSIVGMRGMYEFFDEWGLYIEIAYHGGKFGYGIGERDGDNPEISYGFNTRLDAEKKAFETVFEELEKRLTND
jgi:hypothetical protein